MALLFAMLISWAGAGRPRVRRQPGLRRVGLYRRYRHTGRHRLGDPDLIWSSYGQWLRGAPA